MAEEGITSSENNLNNPSNNILPTVEDSLQARSNQEEGKSAKEEIPKQDYIPPTIILTSPKEENIEAKEANVISKEGNRISWISIAINLFLFLITLGALWQTKLSVDTSKEALDYTKSYTRQKDSTDSAKQVITDGLSKAVSDSNFALQKRSIDAQIKSLKDAQERFEKENQPFLQIYNLQNVKLAPPINASFKFDMEYLGKYAAQQIAHMQGLANVKKEDSAVFSVCKKTL